MIKKIEKENPVWEKIKKMAYRNAIARGPFKAPCLILKDVYELIPETYLVLYDANNIDLGYVMISVVTHICYEEKEEFYEKEITSDFLMIKKIDVKEVPEGSRRFVISWLRFGKTVEKKISI